MAEEVTPNIVLGNRYRLKNQVGTGGMALVYEAYDEMLERPVAIKLLKQDFSESKEFRERFKQEAKAAANLSHPNIVTVYDYGVDSSGVYIVMEYISGTDLKTKILKKHKYTLSEGLPLMVQACAGLGYAHRAGIIHCDVKPHNMLISRDNRLKITDFGIARALSTIATDHQSEIVWGSPQYFSPEQALGGIPSPASDVYSLGVVMYEMFTGRLPFEATSIDDLIKMHQTQIPVAPRQINPEISVELERVLMKVLSKEPSSRYRTADQLGHVLMTLVDKQDNIFVTPPDIPPDYPTQEVQWSIPPVITREDYTTIKKPATDWKLIGLELLALLAVGGLIPFWLFIFFKISPLLR